MKYNPDFQNAAAFNSGYDSQDPSPHLANLLILQHQLFANFFNGGAEHETWDQVIKSIEDDLGFFKSFHCGVRD